MAIKIIKFDLPINGTKVTTLEALRDNLTDEIVKLARTGQLERWFQSRQMHEQAQAVAAAVSQHAEDKVLFLALCAVLEVEVHPDDASAIFDMPPSAGAHVKREEYLHVEHKEYHEAMRIKAKNRISELESLIAKIFTHKITGKPELQDILNIPSERYMYVKFEIYQLREEIRESLLKKTEI